MAAQKEFDKEYIFNLIMPTASGEQTEAADPVPAPEPEAPKAAPQEAESPDSLSLLREKLSQAAPAPVQLRPAREQVLVNLAEQLVADRLDAVFEKFNCCRCDKCRRDVAAFALNTIPPQYVVALPEELPSLLGAAETKEVAGALVKAILHVKSHPKH